jgi:DNA-binding MarR family transcriptional regulator
MAQLAYLHEGVEPLQAQGDPVFALTLSLFGADERRLIHLAEDARACGLAAGKPQPLESLLEGSGGVLGDVVVADCPQIDAGKLAALIRLDERVARAGARLIVATSADALDDVFGCLERSRPQILIGAQRAEGLVALGAALAQLPGRRLREDDGEERMMLLRLTEQVVRIVEKLDRLAPGADGGALRAPERTFRPAGDERDFLRRPRPPLPDPRLVRGIIRDRRRRSKYFDDELFADPAWDILLDLTVARAEHRRVSVSSLCIAAGVPPTTALRWVAQMVESGLLERTQDREDKRRAFIALSDRTADAMARYFAEVDSGRETAI